MKREKGYYSKKARKARSQAYGQRVAMAAAQRMMVNKRKYVKSGMFSKKARQARSLFKALPYGR